MDPSTRGGGMTAFDLQPDLLSASGLLDRADSWWLDSAKRAVRELAGRGSDFTTDDLREMGVPELDNPREQAARWGSLLAAAKAEGLIREVGRRPSTRPSANGRKVTIWQGCQ